MNKKYILEPDGRIRDYKTGDVGEIVENPDASSTDINYLTPIENSANIKDQVSSDRGVFTMEGDEIAALNLDLIGKGDSSNFRTSMDVDEKYNKSFDFLRKESDLAKLGEDANKSFYTPFNYILDSKPQDFATEFEILTGTRLIDSPEDDSSIFDSLLLMFDYFSTIFVQIATIEGIVLVNNLLANIKGGKKPVEQHSLVLGKYTVNNFDIFTRYITDVLNYPWKRSNADERMISFFIGFNEWLAPESTLNISQIVKSSSDGEFLNNYDFASGLLDGTSKTRNQFFILFNMTLLLPLAVIAIEQSLELFLNYTHVKNRFKLLTRKFKQESYWKNDVLNKAKLTRESDKYSTSEFFTQLNYYFVKFAIERMQVGLKILKKYVLDASYMQERQHPNGSNRVSANRSKFKGHVKAPIRKNRGIVGYAWSSENADDSLYNEHRIKPQTTNLRALPQLFQGNNEFFNSLALSGTDPVKTTESIAQNFYTNFKGKPGSNETGYRIPTSVVGAIEAFLDAEYMPFYFHDVRTNEIISFHAFIESISDSFNPEYNTSSGFGRIDDVRSYVKTTRNINLSFTIAATSPEDHDLMWYQINKLVSMVYPQWSDAYDTADGGLFKYPFTQVPTASPLIRLRVGDVIKSNYSRTALSRLHGIGHRKMDEKLNNNKKSSFSTGGTKKYYLQPGQYETYDTTSGTTGLLSLGGSSRPKVINLTHETEIISPPSLTGIRGNDYAKVEISYVENDNPGKENKDPVPETFTLNVDVSKIYVVSQTSSDITDSEFKNHYPMNKAGMVIHDGNPIVKSYESGMSKGLAGFITQLDVNYNEVNWETGRIGSKAPMFVKITLNYAPVHDIPPGLDHTGMMRAPVYNVGRLLNSMYHNTINPISASKSGKVKPQAESVVKVASKPAEGQVKEAKKAAKDVGGANPATASPPTTPDAAAKNNALKAEKIVPIMQLNQSQQKRKLIGDETLKKIQSGEIIIGKGRLPELKPGDFSSMEKYITYDQEWYLDG